MKLNLIVLIFFGFISLVQATAPISAENVERTLRPSEKIPSSPRGSDGSQNYYPVIGSSNLGYQNNFSNPIDGLALSNLSNGSGGSSNSFMDFIQTLLSTLLSLSGVDMGNSSNMNSMLSGMGMGSSFDSLSSNLGGLNFNNNSGGLRSSIGGSSSGGSNTNNFDFSTGNYGGMPADEGVASIAKVTNSGAKSALAQGTITINGHTYQFNSGGFGNGYLPEGQYQVSNPRLRTSKGMYVKENGQTFGYSFDLSDQFDGRVGKQRTALRIHPDGGNPGTMGCIGIVGGIAVQQQFYQDMNTVLQQSGGTTQIYVRYSS